MGDSIEQMREAEARRLATDLLRDVTLALEYRERVAEFYEDSNGRELIEDWMLKAGYGTTYKLFAKELTWARQTNLAAWDGAYLLRLDGRIMLVLQIGAEGVMLNEEFVRNAAFANGVLTFAASDRAPWNGELRFSRIEPSPEDLLKGAGTYQLKVDGSLWKSGDKPATNCHGATTRITLIPPKTAAPTDGANALQPMAAMRLGDAPAAPVPASWKGFVERWHGAYKVTLQTAVGSYAPGPSYSVAKVVKPATTVLSDGTTDASGTKSAQVNYGAIYNLSLATTATRPEHDRITYSDGTNTFDLSFAEVDENTVVFDGVVYPVNGTQPTYNNVSGLAERQPTPGSSWDGPNVALTVIGAIGTLGVVLSCILIPMSVVFGNKLDTELEKADATVDVMHEIEEKLNKLELDLARHLEIDYNPDNFSLRVVCTDENMRGYGNRQLALDMKHEVEKLERKVEYSAEKLEKLKAGIEALHGEMAVPKARYEALVEQIKRNNGAGSMEDFAEKERLRSVLEDHVEKMNTLLDARDQERQRLDVNDKARKDLKKRLEKWDNPRRA